MSDVDAVYARMVELRRALHRQPELAFEEALTAQRIGDELARLGIEYSYSGAGSAVVGRIAGNPEGPTVALRAEMDALPGAENTDLPFASTIDEPVNAKGPMGRM